MGCCCDTNGGKGRGFNGGERVATMRTILAAISVAGAFALPAVAQPGPAPTALPANQASSPPRLVIVISVDQLSSDLFAQYRPYFTGGLRRLSEGVVFPSGYQAHAATETCPGHSTILTGSHPARTGIVANTWFNPSATREDKAVYCAEDPGVAGSSSRQYTVSVNHLRVPALGEYMRRQLPGARTVSVAGKDRAAVMMAGRDPEQVWWWNGQTFASHAGRQAPQALTRANAAVAQSLTQRRPGFEVPPVCAARARPVAVGGTTIGAGRLGREAGDRSAFRASPDADGAVLAIGAGLQQELRLGQGAAPDLLILGLSATDYVGHTFGTQGQEMCTQLMGLDRELGNFFQMMDRTGIDYLVALTSDHGGNDIPERQDETGVPSAARVEAGLNASAMGRALGQRLGLQGPILYGDGAFGDMYVDRALPTAQRARVLQEAVRTYRAHPQVAAVFTADQLRAAPLPTTTPDTWTLLDRARASFDVERSGDFVVLLKPVITPIADPGRGYTATHGSPYDYDRRVPILFWRRGMTGFEQPIPVQTVDILPTLGSLLRLQIPQDRIDGRCRDLVEGPETSCR